MKAEVKEKITRMMKLIQLSMMKLYELQVLLLNLLGKSVVEFDGKNFYNTTQAFI